MRYLRSALIGQYSCSHHPLGKRKAITVGGGGASVTSTLKKSSPPAARFYRFQTHPLWETHFLNPGPSSQRSATGPCGTICPLTIHPSTVVRGRTILESNAPGCTHWCVRRPLAFPIFPARGDFLILTCLKKPVLWPNAVLVYHPIK